MTPVDVPGEHRPRSRLFETYSQGDYAAAAACLAPGVVYEVGQEVPAVGHDEVRSMWERWDGAWEDMETVPEEFLDAGEHVVVTVRYSARGQGRSGWSGPSCT